MVIMVNVGRYRIHGCYGLVHPKDPGIKLACVFFFCFVTWEKNLKRRSIYGDHSMGSGQIIYSFFVKGTLKKASQSTGFPVFRQGKSKFIFLHDGFSIFDTQNGLDVIFFTEVFSH